MIYKVVDGKDIRETNENIDCVPEFKCCNNKTMKYVVLMNDYNSPYIRMPLKERKEMVLLNLGYSNKRTIENFFYRNKDHISKATEIYNGIQYNQEYESLLSMKAYIQELNDIMSKPKKTDKERTIAHKAFENMSTYQETLKEMEQKVGWLEDYGASKVKKGMTTLEIYHQEQEEK